MKINWKFCIAHMGASVGVAAAVILLTLNGMESGHNLVRSVPFVPAWLFLTVWGALYIFMGLSACFISSAAGSQDCGQALCIYGIQLFLSVCWLAVLFLLNGYVSALFLFAVLWVFVLLMILRFAEINRLASKLQLPYLIWLTLTGCFNIMVCLLD